MITWRFTPDDVAGIRFGFSPVLELVLGLIVLRAPGRYALHLPWIRAARPALADLDLDLDELFALVPVRGATADFLTPTATSPLPDIAEELEHLRATEPDRLIEDVAQVAAVPADLTRRIRDDPRAAAHRIAGTLQACWDATLRDHWPRIRTLLEADVLWRARQLAAGGARGLFGDLHPTVTWHGDRLTAADPFDYAGTLSGEGLLLSPSAMCWPDVRKMIEPYQPTVVYPARGIATLWETGRAPTSDALAALVGRSRARILAALAEPSSTTTLARRLALTPGAVSQHLAILYDCGLVTRSRHGRSVLYQRTRTGDSLATATATATASGEPG